MNKMPFIYIAGPLFTPAERHYLEEITIKIEQQLECKTFLPHRDVGLITEEHSETQIFREDLNYLDKADIIIAILNGTDIDSGTAFEIGYSYAMKKPIFGLIEDIRFSRELNINLMIKNAVNIYTSREKLIEALSEFIKS